MTDTEVRQRLDGLLRGLDDTLRALAELPLGEQAAGEGDARDPHDSAAGLTDYAEQEAVAVQARAQRQEVLAALERLAAGRYGRCVDCGKAIPPERLAARPEAARCVADQAKAESLA